MRATQIRPLYQVLLGFPGELNSCHADVRSSSLSNQSRRDGVGRRFQRRRVSAASPSFPTAPSVNARSPRAETSSHQLAYSQTLATLWPGEWSQTSSSQMPSASRGPGRGSAPPRFASLGRASLPLRSTEARRAHGEHCVVPKRRCARRPRRTRRRFAGRSTC